VHGSWFFTLAQAEVQGFFKLAFGKRRCFTGGDSGEHVRTTLEVRSCSPLLFLCPSLPKLAH
jgi:hypothetical protein